MNNVLLLAIDYINDIVNPHGAIAKCAPEVQRRSVLANAAEFLEVAKESNFITASVNVQFDPKFYLCPTNSPIFGSIPRTGALKEGSWGTEMDSRLGTDNIDVFLPKRNISAFSGSSLQSLISAQSIDTIIVGGVSTSMAVQSTIKDGHDRGLRCFVYEPMCADRSESLHRSALEIISPIATILDTREAIASITSRD